ncbi:Hsp70 protein [Antricoccus suffuscus]|uniref:Hsp70 protein n=1 Tax=Antricoccus suffuscus TaxID=1629062 RepID=A0A2T0ZZ72_9ACTN|nr:Hsp70 family protein [Antricoccus suffuscus]PRZ41651.1 Hsp70 protein [Antricoccus suffuscus]
MRVLAVDFGTSNTVAAVSVDGAPPRVLAIDGKPLLPSSIYLADDGSIAVGSDAERQARLDPSRFEPNPKRRIDDGEMLLGTDVIPVQRAIAAVFSRVLQEFRRQFGNANPDVVRLTHPARWRQTRKDVLIAACKEAGLSDNPILVPEPVGAATHFATQGGHQMPPGAALAVYDLGGGTFDVAIVQKRDAGFEVIAEAGIPDLGGLDFDHAILEYIGRVEGESHAEDWARLNRPTDTESRRKQRALAVDVREGKEALSRHPHTDIALSSPFKDVHLTRSEFEEMIRSNLTRSVELLATTISEANFTSKDLMGVYLVGGSSRVPLVARLIQEGMGITPSTLDQPESTVVTGALYLNVGPRPGTAPQARPMPGMPPGQRPNTGGAPAQQQPASGGVPAQARGPMGGATQRVNPADLPAVRTVRPQQRPAPGNVRRLPGPNAYGATRPPTGATSSPGPTQRPPVERPRTAAGPQRPPTGNSPMSNPSMRPGSGSTQAHRPPTGPISTPISAPRNLVGTGSGPMGGQRQQDMTRPAGSAPNQQLQTTNWKPMIWAIIFAAVAILIAILIANI